MVGWWRRVLVLVAGGQGWWLVVRSRGRQCSVRAIFGAVDTILAKVHVLVLPSGTYHIVLPVSLGASLVGRALVCIGTVLH